MKTIILVADILLEDGNIIRVMARVDKSESALNWVPPSLQVPSSLFAGS